MLTFEQALQEAQGKLNESKKSDFDDLSKLLTNYETYSDFKNVKTGINTINFDYNNKKIKITVQFGEIEVLANNKSILNIEIRHRVLLDDTDAIIDAIKKLK